MGLIRIVERDLPPPDEGIAEASSAMEAATNQYATEAAILLEISFIHLPKFEYSTAHK